MLIEDYRVDILFLQNMKNFLSTVRDEAIREKIPVSNNHAENRFSVAARLHPFFPFKFKVGYNDSHTPAPLRPAQQAKAPSFAYAFSIVLVLDPCLRDAPRMQSLESSLTRRAQRLEPSLTLLLFAQVKGRVLCNVVRVNEDAIYGLFLILTRFSGFEILVGLFRG